eukprot:1176047-Prorocentrum_minimum.AAC.10
MCYSALRLITARLRANPPRDRAKPDGGASPPRGARSGARGERGPARGMAAPNPLATAGGGMYGSGGFPMTAGLGMGSTGGAFGAGQVGGLGAYGLGGAMGGFGTQGLGLGGGLGMGGPAGLAGLGGAGAGAGAANVTTVQLHVPSTSVGSILGKGGANIQQVPLASREDQYSEAATKDWGMCLRADVYGTFVIEIVTSARVFQVRQFSGARVKLHNSEEGSSERTVEIAGTPEQVLPGYLPAEKRYVNTLNGFKDLSNAS